MSSRFVSRFAVVSGMLFLAGCLGSSDSTPTAAGPIDGTYINVSTPPTCFINGGSTQHADSGSLPATFVAIGGTFSYLSTKNAAHSCQATDSGTLTFGASNSFTLTQTNQTCSSGCQPSDNCQANSTAQAANVGTYSLSGSTLTLTFTNSGCSSNSGNTGTDTEINGGYVKQ